MMALYRDLDELPATRPALFAGELHQALFTWAALISAIIVSASIEITRPR